jgi:hypothetical protein
MACQPATRSERGAWNAALTQLREIGATPAQLRAKVAAYRRRWPGIDMTPMALVHNWSLLGTPAPQGVRRSDAPAPTAGRRVLDNAL